MPTIDELIRRRADDGRVGMAFGARTWTHHQVTVAQAQRAAVMASLQQPGPSTSLFCSTTCPSSCSGWGERHWPGRFFVGGNPTHRGDELARDFSHTQCQLLITNAEHRGLLEGHDLGPALPEDRILVIDDPSGDLRSGPQSTYGALLGGVAGAPLPDQNDTQVTEETLGYLLFTSGTSGAPKACLCSQGRMARIGTAVAQLFELTSEDVCYVSMPLFHSNALMAGLGAGPVRRRHGGPARAVQCLWVPARCPSLRRHLLQLRGQAALLHTGHAGTPR